ncbi:MAG: hypothetical protein Q7S66_01480 [bacterium]|nr:hypothetical protein [bacterium]
MRLHKFIAILGAGALLLSSVPSSVLAAPATFVQQDPGYDADAPNTVDIAQDATVLAPGVYGTTLSENVYYGPALGGTGQDSDYYKLTIQRGVMARFKVTPQNGQDMWMALYDSDGKAVGYTYHVETNSDYPRTWNYEANFAAAGFPEKLDYYFS